MELEQIQKRIEALDRAQKELKVLKTTIDDALIEDSAYQEVDLELREIATKKKRIKDEISSTPANREVATKIKEVRDEISDLQEILNQELLEWRQAHDSDEIITADGSTRKLRISVRLQSVRTAE